MKNDVGSKYRFSVIIPTLNEEKVIGGCLEALHKNSSSFDNFEVIIIDNGSTDRTIEVVEQFRHFLHIRVITVRGVHISALRNRGAKEARGEIFAFLDADCLPPLNWLVSANEIFKSMDEGVIGAHYQIPDDATWVGRIWFEDRMSNRVGVVTYVPAGDLMIRRELFNLISGFDETLQTNEDFDICQRVIQERWPVKAYPELRVIHLGTPRTLLGFYKKQRWHGMHVFRVFLRDPKKRKNLRPVLVSIYTLGCLLGLACGIAVVLLRATWLVLGFSALALALPTATLSLMRAATRRKWQEALPLAVLYLTFGVARARCLLNYRAWSQTSRTG